MKWNSLILFLLLPLQVSFAQVWKLPQDFKQLSGKYDAFAEALKAARKLADGSDEFWFGYSFELRGDINLYDIYIDRGGQVNFMHGSRSYHYHEDEDVETVTLRALSQLGDKSAQQELESRRRFIRDDFDWGLFFLIDAKSLRVKRLQLFNFDSRDRFGQPPVVWLPEVSNDISLAFLQNIIEEDAYRGSVIKPAVFVLSLHEHAGGIPYLTRLAASELDPDIRKTAAFWLGQIPKSESLKSLVELYGQEQNSEMKEKLIFAISQHDSERAVSILIDIAEKDSDSQVREKAIFWLGQMAGKRTLQALGNIVDYDPETEIKTKAVFAISQHGDKQEAADMLISIARDHPNPEVRRKAMFWLGQMGDERAVRLFKEILTQ